MRLIGQLPAEADARRFVDYLLTQKVAAHAEEGRAGWDVWIEHDDQLDAGRTELDAFRQNPLDPRYAAAGQAARIRQSEQKAAEQRRRNFRDVRTTVFAAPTAATPVTLFVIGLCVAVFVITRFGGPKGDRVEDVLDFRSPPNVVLDGDGYVESVVGAHRGMMFDDVARGQVWRLLTPALMHGDVLHILFNMMWVLDLGRRIEPRKGPWVFGGLMLAIAVLSNAAQAAWVSLSPFYDFDYSPFLGYSGVVAGLLGYAFVRGKLRPYEGIGVTRYETGFMLVFLVLCSVGAFGGIANAAHWGGLTVGAAIGLIGTRKRRIKA